MKRRIVMKMTTGYRKLFAVAITALTLVGCGGGGSESTPEPLPALAPIGILVATAPSCSVQASSNKCVVTLTSTTANASTVKLTNGEGAVLSTSLSGSLPVDVLIGLNTYTLTEKGVILASVTVTGECAIGTASNGSTCVSPPATTGYAWNDAVKAWVADTDNKVFTANQLPVGCNSLASQCWKDAVANGTVKFIATTASMTGYNSRPVMFAYFKNTTAFFGATGMWNYLPVYADDGSLVDSDISGGVAQEIDWVSGNSLGVIVHVKETGTCVQRSWNLLQKAWTDAPAPCQKTL